MWRSLQSHIWYLLETIAGSSFLGWRDLWWFLMHKAQASHRQEPEKEASTPWDQVATGIPRAESAGPRTSASFPRASWHSYDLTSLLCPTCDCGQAGLYELWFSSHPVGTVTSTLFCVIFSPRVSIEQTDNRDSEFLREEQNSLLPVMIMSLSFFF